MKKQKKKKMAGVSPYLSIIMCDVNELNFPIKRHRVGWVQWFTLVIPAFERPRWADHLRSGVQDQPGQHGETPSLLKIQKKKRNQPSVVVVCACNSSYQRLRQESLEPTKRRL